MRRIAFILCAAIALTSLTGCTTEIYDRLLIKAIGIDREKDEFSISVRAADFKNDEEYIIKSKGKTVFSALSDLSERTGDIQLYSHMYFIAVGQSMLKEDLRNSLDFFYRYYKSQVTAILYLAEDKASDIIECRKDKKLISSEEIAKIATKVNNSGKVIDSSLMDFVSDSERPGGGAILSVIKSGKDELSVSGSALFENYRYLASCTPAETEGLLMAKGNMKNGSVSAETDEGMVSAEINACKAKLEQNGENKYKLSLEAEVSLASSAGYQPDGNGYSAISKAFSEEIKKKATAALKKTYKSGCDILGIGYKLYLESSEEWRNSEKDWSKIVSGFSFDINASVKIRRIGEENFPYG